MTEHALEPRAQLNPAIDAAEPDAAISNDAATRGATAGAPGTQIETAPPAIREVGQEGATACTQAQLRRFIKSRPYVPLHELRRRFGLNGSDDDVALVEVDGHRLFVGLPARESGLLGDLLRQGEVGYELLLDPTSPIIIGVFPMRPVQRP
jgi:hypothetical protein